MNKVVPLQRTLVVAVGRRGGHVARQLIEEIGRRHGGVPVVAVLHIADQPAEDADLSISVPAKSDWLAVREALDASRAAVQSLFRTTLQRISHLRHRRTLAGTGLRLDRLDEVAVFIVADLGEAAGSAWVLPLARWVAEVVSEQFGATPVATGLLILPSADLDEMAVAGARAAIDELDAAQRLPPCGDIGWLSPFNRGCYVLGPFNEEGLTLADADMLTQVVALGLYLHIFTPARDGLDWLPASLSLDRRPTYASFGVALRTWPGRTAARVLAHHWAAKALEGLLQESPERPAPAILDLAPSRLIAERLLPADLLPALVSPLKQYAAPAPWRLHALRAEIDAGVAERTRRLGRTRGQIERSVSRLAERTTHELRQRLAAVLASEPVGSLVRAQNLANALTDELHAYAEGLDTRLDEDQEGLERIEAQARAAAEALDVLVEAFPRWTVRELLSLLGRPMHMLRLAMRYRQVQAAVRRYLLLRDSELEARLTVALEEEACGLYDAVHQGLAEARRGLTALRRAMLEALDRLCNPPLIPEDEASLLDDELLEILRATEVGPAVEGARGLLLEWAPLPHWWEDRVTAAEVVKQMLAVGQAQLARVAEMSAEDAVRLRYPDPDARATWLADLMAEAQPLWRFDLTRLEDAERELVGRVAALGVADPTSSPLAASVDDEGRPLRLIRLADPSCLVVLQLARGAPLESLAWPDGTVGGGVSDVQKPRE
jgi:hypothetical protein